MALPDPLPERYDRKTPMWWLLGWCLLVSAVAALLVGIASALPVVWAATLLVFAVLYLVGLLWLPLRLLAGGRVALVFDAEGLEDRTSGRVRRASWSNVKRVRLVKGLYSTWIGVWFHEDPSWARPSKPGTDTRNEWSAEDFTVNQLWTLLDYDDACRLFEHYGGVRVTY